MYSRDEHGADREPDRNGIEPFYVQNQMVPNWYSVLLRIGFDC